MEIPKKLNGKTPNISVLLSDRHSDEYKYFHCVVCGKIVFGYNNDEVRMIIPTGQPKTSKPQTTIRCMNRVNIGEPSIILHELIAAVFANDSVQPIRAKIAELVARYPENKSANCDAKYYVG